MFTGLGDANPGNVSRMMAPHLIRMAETRAKARALRDAINLAEALADDPGSEDDPREPEGGDVPTTHGRRAEPSTIARATVMAGPERGPTPDEAAEHAAYEKALARWDTVRDAALAAGIAFKSPTSAGATTAQLTAWADRLERELR
jgi:hypothetical protein